jgi:recombination protein RecT
MAVKTAEKKKSGNGRSEGAQTLITKTPEDITDMMEAWKPKISQVLPTNVSPNRLLQIAHTIITKDQMIMKCTEESVVGAIMQVAILGLDPTPVLSHCYLIPYYNKDAGKYELQFQLGYRGIVNLVKRGKENPIRDVRCYVVREGDQFDYELGLKPNILHRPLLDRKSEGKLIHAYTIFDREDGSHLFAEPLNEFDIASIRQMSQAWRKYGQNSVWGKFDTEMWKKASLKRDSKLVLTNIDVAKTLAVDEVTLTPSMFSDDKSGVDPAKVEVPEEDVQIIQDEEPAPDAQEDLDLGK